jgi:muramidase (phage lysozyme)
LLLSFGNLLFCLCYFASAIVSDEEHTVKSLLISSIQLAITPGTMSGGTLEQLKQNHRTKQPEQPEKSKRYQKIYFHDHLF